jgi:hypothetical protein
MALHILQFTSSWHQITANLHMTAKNMDVTRVNPLHKICCNIQKKRPHDGYLIMLLDNNMYLERHEFSISCTHMGPMSPTNLSFEKTQIWQLWLKNWPLMSNICLQWIVRLSCRFKRHFFQGNIVGKDNDCLYALYDPDFVVFSNIMTSSGLTYFNFDWRTLSNCPLKLSMKVITNVHSKVRLSTSIVIILTCRWHGPGHVMCTYVLFWLVHLQDKYPVHLLVIPMNICTSQSLFSHSYVVNEWLNRHCNVQIDIGIRADELGKSHAFDEGIVAWIVISKQILLRV